MFFYIIIFITLLSVELVFIRLAKKYKIFDYPDSRKLHSSSTIRGGGGIFLLSVIFWILFKGWEFKLLLPAFGILIFFLWDDIKSINPLIKLTLQIIFVIAALYDNANNLDYIWLVFFIYVLSGINFFNFMDGINGMLVLYSISILITLLYINNEKIIFQENSLLITILISNIIFAFFNFRKNAILFAGDVGSIGVAFILLYLIICLIITSTDYYYISLTAIFFLDAGLTLIRRVILRENIFKPHKQHLYQKLAISRKLNHFQIASLYSVLQIILNFLIIKLEKNEYRLFIVITYIGILIITYFYTIQNIEKNDSFFSTKD